ncbi:hypothetical protein ACEWY4_002037 [Coilia grayii]|uniref:DNA-directed DNA polymerase n=1 Tax=Coilia grayii TaxID=363190 RepID=A0ABD1KUN1_9TELE
MANPCKRMRFSSTAEYIAAINNKIDNMYGVVTDVQASRVLTDYVSQINNGIQTVYDRVAELGGAALPINTHVADVQRGCGSVNRPTGPSAQPCVDTQLSEQTIDRLRRQGGTVGLFHVAAHPRFHSLTVDRQINFRGAPDTDIADYIAHVVDSLSEVLDFCKTLGGADCVLNVSLRGDSLATPVNAILYPSDKNPLDSVLSAIEQVLQSNSRIMTDHTVILSTTIVREHTGGVRRKAALYAHDELIRQKRMHLYCPNNSTNQMCFSYCLVNALNPNTHPGEIPMLAKEMHARAGLKEQDSVGFRHLPNFEALYNVRIVVYFKDELGVFTKHKTSDAKTGVKTVVLYLYKGHYYGVLNPAGFLGHSYYCESCCNGYDSKLTHMCDGYCMICLTGSCKDGSEGPVYCVDCNRYCQSHICYVTHKRGVAMRGVARLVAPCERTKYCRMCNRIYQVSINKPKQHKCTAMMCKHCSAEMVPETDHECFIQPIKPKKQQNKYIFFDLETRYEDGKHRANFASAMTFAGELFAAEGMDCVVRMLDHFRRPKFQGFTWMAHNASGFDNMIILEHFCNMSITPRITMMGCRIIFMYDALYKQRFIDSFSFMPMALSKTTAAFNLQTCEKGYFPHGFNTLANRHYIGPYPDKVHYGYECMGRKAQIDFDLWYAEASKHVFDFQKELHRYGVNDVVLLREACMKYREEFISCTNFDPFSVTTLASCCMAVYKTLFLPPDTLALTHNNAYVYQHKAFSNVSIQWLEYVKHSRNVDVRHALNGGEVAAGRYFLDGYYNQNGIAHALEFNGCAHHGHSCRYAPDSVHPLSKVPYSVLRRHFDDKVAYLANDRGFQVEVVWECEWLHAKSHDPNVMAFMANYVHPERLKPRDALFGGRTNAYQLYYKVKPGEQIHYVDFTSLYPSCQSLYDYPTHHPQIILSDFQPIENYFGLIKATVLPPRGLLHPVLPHRCNGKLMFPLCRVCAETLNQTTPCVHSDAERSLKGCWVSLELLKAIEKGYVIQKVDEVWHFPNKSGDLFVNYVKTFLQYKQEASGYPAHAVTDGEKKAYIDQYFQKEGIRLNPDKICVNTARRNINKLLLNSLWGRFSMRENLCTTEVIKDPEQFSRFIFGSEYEVTHFSFVSEDVALLQWKHDTEACVRTPDINVFIGAFTTARARLRLYELMDRLGDRLLYSDTDSVIYVSREGDWNPPLGNFLGELTSELAEGDYITEFCSGGPKTYGYLTAQGKSCMKAKGITLNAENAQHIRLDTLVDLVHDYVKDRDSTRHVLARVDNIVRVKHNISLKNKSSVKKFKVVYNKRVLLPDYTTLPYGY